MGQVLSEDWAEKTRWPAKQEAVKFAKIKQNNNDKERITLWLHDMTEQNLGVLLFYPTPELTKHSHKVDSATKVTTGT